MAASAAPVEGSRSKVVPRITVSIDLHGIRPYVKFFHVRAYPVDFLYLLDMRPRCSGIQASCMQAEGINKEKMYVS
jgi:hypothetical protein